VVRVMGGKRKEGVGAAVWRKGDKKKLRERKGAGEQNNKQVGEGEKSVSMGLHGVRGGCSMVGMDGVLRPPQVKNLVKIYRSQGDDLKWARNGVVALEVSGRRSRWSKMELKMLGSCI